MADQEKTFTCEQCGKEKKESERFEKDGKSFCCTECCGKQGAGEKDPAICEFC